MFEAVVDLLGRRRWVVLALVGVVTAGAAWLAVGIRFDFSPQAVLEGDDDLVRTSEAFKRTFGSDDATVMVVLEATGEAGVLTAEALTWQAAAAGRLAALPAVRRVESLVDLPAPTLSLSPPWGKLEPIVTDLPVDAATAERLAAAVADMPLLEGAMISRDGRLAALVVQLDPAKRDIDSLTRIVGQIHQCLGARAAPAGYTVHLTGIPVLRVDIVKNLKSDLLSLLPLAAVGFIVVLAVVFRRLSGTLLPLLAVGVGLAWTTAGVVLAGQSLNIVSNVLPILLFVVGMANCVHIVSRYSEDAARQGITRPAAVRSTMSHMAMACLLTSVTTAIGFGSLLAARSTVLQSLGAHAVAGMALLYVSSMVLFAAMLGWFSPPPRSRRGGSPGLIARAVAASGRAVSRRPWPVLAGSVALIAACLLAGRNVAINSYMIETYDEDHPTLRTLRLVERRLAGILPLDVALKATSAGTLLTPETFAKVAEVQRFAERNEQVLLTRSYVDVHTHVQAAVAGRAGAGAALPPPGEAGRLRIWGSGQIIERLGDTSGYSRLMSPDGREARVLLRLRDAGTREELALIGELEAKLTEVFPAGCGIEATLTGDVYLHAHAMDRFVRDMLRSLLGASVVIFMVIALLFRSGRLGAIAILPNLTPLVLTLGYMGVRGYDMNAGNVIVFAVSLGIAVDGTIHFLARFREEIQAGDSVAEAIYRSYISTGRAIVLTCILIVGGLSVLGLSKFLPSRRFAELMGVTMFGALVGDLLLLPACLRLFWKPKAPRPSVTAAR